MLPPFLELFRYERSSFRYSGYPLDLNKSHVCETVFLSAISSTLLSLKVVYWVIYIVEEESQEERDIGYVTFNLDSGLDCV